MMDQEKLQFLTIIQYMSAAHGFPLSLATGSHTDLTHEHPHAHSFTKEWAK